MERLLLRDLWPTIRRLVKHAHQTQAAIAYVSTNGDLPLRRNDILIVDASPASIKGGETSAKILKRLHKVGVAIYSYPGLHAKVLIADHQVIVGSGNASRASAGKLTEAAILSTSPILHAQASAFLHQLTRLSQPLEQKDLERLARIKLIRRRRGSPNARRRRRIHAQGHNFWFTTLIDLNENAFPNERPLVEQAEHSIKSSHPKADPTWMRFTGSSAYRRNAKAGDVVIVAASTNYKKRPYDVAPPSAILLRQDRKPWTRFYYDPHLARPKQPITWGVFKKLLKTVGLRRNVTINSTFRIPWNVAAEIDRLWPR